MPLVLVNYTTTQLSKPSSLPPLRTGLSAGAGCHLSEVLYLAPHPGPVCPLLQHPRLCPSDFALAHMEAPVSLPSARQLLSL